MSRLAARVAILLVGQCSPLFGTELLVKFTASAQTEAWAPRPGTADSLPILHRAAGARRVAPLVPATRTDASFEARGLGRILVVTLEDRVDPPTAIDRYLRTGLVEYAVPNHTYRLALAPGDSLQPQQWALARIRAREGWAIERGNRDVIVAIVDTGVDYLHPDLAPNIWVNAAEDINGNGSFDPFPASGGGDLDGLDNDGNGFVDDVIGWDFADAPELPGTGDWRKRDNDPMDEGPSSHGTHVAGIACAVADNGIGVAGVAPGCRIMALRAGFGPLGYLQEDDVSAAIVYAVHNGASVINMSWGDVVVSPVIKDVLAYAHEHGCVLVASAGNSGTDAVHYPSGYEETISVGSTTSTDALASYSNFGPVLDVVAPGSGILSTFIGGSYGTNSGTSMAAPHVSGLAALVRSLHPEFRNEEVRAAIRAGAIDLGVPGRDDTFGAGRIDVPRSLMVEEALALHVRAPSVDGAVCGDTPIVGTVSGLTVRSWEVSVRGLGPWATVAGPFSHQVLDDTLAVWRLGDIPDGPVTLRVTARAWDGSVAERLVPLTVDRTPPGFAGLRVTPVLEGPFWQQLLEWTTDDVATLVLWIRRAGSAEQPHPFPLPYLTTSHRWLLGPETPGAGRWEVRLEATNRAGLGTLWAPPELEALTVDATPLGRLSFEETPSTLPPGYLVPRLVDFDGNGWPEVVIGTLVPSPVVPGATTLGPMAIYEAGPHGWSHVPSGAMTIYPLDAADGDRDGLVEVLGTYVASTTRSFSFFLWEPSTPGSFPSRIAWADSSNLLAAGIADTDRDGWGEIYAFDQSIYPHRAVVVCEADGDDRWAVVDTLSLPEGLGELVPRVMTRGDLDGDGMMEVVFCTTEGSFVAYRGVPSSGQPWCVCRTEREGSWYAQAVCAADVDGDGIDELVGLSRLNENLNLEHTFDARRWSLAVFRCAGEDASVVSDLVLLGAITETAFNSLSAGDVDGDGDAEVLVCAYPDYYVLDYAWPGEPSVAWYAHGASTTSSVLDVIKGTLTLVLGFPDRTAVVRGRPTSLPSPPGYVAAVPRSLDAILLTWSAVPNADGYRVFRGTSPDSLTPLAAWSSTSYVDSSVVPFVTYWYAVATIDSTFSPPEGGPSHAVSASTNEPPTVCTARFLAPSHVSLTFTEPLDGSAREPGRYALGPDALSPSSAVLTDEDRTVLLAFRTLPQDGDYFVGVTGVSDRTGIPVPEGTGAWVTIRRARTFYVREASYEGDGWVAVRFSAPVDPSAGLGCFGADPPLTFTEVDHGGAQLRLRALPPWKVDGTRYVLTVRDLTAADGTPLAPSPGDRASFFFFAEDLAACHPVPNPFRLDGSPTPVRFVGCPPDATVVVYDLAGRILGRVSETTPDGVIEWDGAGLSSGVFVYRVHSSGGTKTGRVVAIR